MLWKSASSLSLCKIHFIWVTRYGNTRLSLQNCPSWQKTPISSFQIATDYKTNSVKLAEQVPLRVSRAKAVEKLSNSNQNFVWQRFRVSKRFCRNQKNPSNRLSINELWTKNSKKWKGKGKYLPLNSSVWVPGQASLRFRLKLMSFWKILFQSKLLLETFARVK